MQFLAENGYLQSVGRIVICVYRPHAGKEEALLELLREHLPVVKSQRMVTDRKPVVMRAADRSIIEVFEWQSAEAISKAHENPAVKAPLAALRSGLFVRNTRRGSRIHSPFSEFEAINQVVAVATTENPVPAAMISEHSAGNLI